MKCLYLVCNAHIDPVWMWDWNEGAATTLSTFYTAAQLADEFDYIFCHNEAMLYEYIEQYDAKLFKKISALIKEGKWKIMGGWYLQPDVLIPNGESILRQIYLGKKYFSEKFGVEPTTAMNVDSFGHSRGLVQILSKTGYDSYIICRPYEDELILEENPIKWVGYDGSEVVLFRVEGEGTYCSVMGQAKDNVLKKMKCFEGKDYGMVFWGVGNHGGGPSRKDLKEINELISESEFTIKHSYPEAYFASVNPKSKVDISLRENCFHKCYSSMSRIKRKHLELENNLYFTEKLLSIAHINKNLPYPAEKLEEAMRAMAFGEFHDILPGTCAPDGEESALKHMDYGLRLLQEATTKAFFALIEDFEQAQEGVYPVFAFNPNPYEIEEVFETELLILNPIASDIERYELTAYQNGKEVPLQIIKELSNINYDRRKRFAIKAKLQPMGVERFDLHISIVEKIPLPKTPDKIVLEDRYKKITIDKNTGLMSSYIYNGKELLSGNIFEPYVFDDNADPWGWKQSIIGENMRKMKLSDGTEPLFLGLESCKITEFGDVLTQVESNFVKESISLRLVYKVYKDMPYMDIDCEIFYNDKLKGVRLGFDVDHLAQVETMFGKEPLVMDSTEAPMQRFIRFDNGLTILNDSTFSCMGDDSGTYFTLLNGSCYCAHFIEGRPLIDDSRYIAPIEIGRHLFSFRVMHASDGDEAVEAVRFNQKVHSLNHFPHGQGKAPLLGLNIDSRLALVALRKVNTGYEVRLFNNSKNQFTALIDLFNVKKEISFTPFEVMTILFSGNDFNECEKAIDINR